LLFGILTPLIIYSLVLGIHLLLPTKTVAGYVIDPKTNRAFNYRLNGLSTTLSIIIIWALLCAAGALPWDWFYLQRWWSLLGALIIGGSYTFWVVVNAAATGRGLITDIFLGRVDNIQYFSNRVDAKMFLYLAGAIMLILNVLSFSAFHVQQVDPINPGILLSAALLTLFVFDYLIFERVHLYTYDLFAEKVGFKLGWGCLVFYPYFYTVGIWGTAHLPQSAWIAPHTKIWLTLCGLLFATGWCLTRGANLQKYTFKRDPNHVFLGLFKPQVLTRGNQHLLYSGFWKIARHVNYLGEILMALAITLAIGHPESLWPWLYPLYYVILLGTRDRDDDQRCAEKYGALWGEYKKRVPARIIPKFY